MTIRPKKTSPKPKIQKPQPQFNYHKLESVWDEFSYSRVLHMVAYLFDSLTLRHVWGLTMINSKHFT